MSAAELRWSAEEGVSLERALGVGRALLAGAAAAEVAIYAASSNGDGRVLGAYQRREDALIERADGPAILRRATGGPTAVAGEGVLYLALALDDASALMQCPRDRVLNRNVRPILAALRRLGGAAHYFGREHVSLDRRPAGLVAWTRAPSGAVLLELFLGATRSFAVPDAELAIAPSAPRRMGKQPITAAEALSSPPTSRALAEACAGACASMRALEIGELEVTPLAAIDAPLPSMRWSRAHEVPIGIVRAGLALDAGGHVAHAALTGDFFQDAGAPERLRRALVGQPPTPERVRDALNATNGPGRAVIEGLRALQPVLEAFLELTPG